MAHVALPLLVLLPLLAAAAALAAPPAWTRRAALAGAGLTFLLAAWACVAAPHALDLRAWFERGPLARGFDRAGVDDPLLREALRDLVGAPLPPDEEAALLARLAHVDAARATLGWVEGISPPDLPRVEVARAAVRHAEAEAAGLQAVLSRLRADLALEARLAYGRSGERVRLPWTRPWLPPLGVAWALGADGLNLPLALATALVVLLALAAAPDPRPAARPGPLRAAGPGEGTRGAVVAVLALEALVLAMLLALDVALLLVAWALLLVPTYVLVAARGHAPARAALRVVGLGAAGALVALVGAGALVTRAGTPGGWSVLLLHEAARAGEVPLALQEWFLLALLVATACRLPLGRAPGEALAAVPGWAQGVAVWAVLVGAAYPLLRLGLALAPEAALGRLAAPAALLGLVALVAGGVAVLRAAAPTALLTGAVSGHVGLVLVGVAAARTTAASGAVLTLLVGGLAAAALAPLLRGLVDRAGRPDLEGVRGLGRPAPRLAALAALGLALLGGLTAATALVVGGALASGVLPRAAGVGALLGAALLAAAHLRLVHALVSPPAAGEPPRVPDLGDAEALASLPLLVAAALVGVVTPTLALDLVAPAAEWLTGVAATPGLGG
ncbi:MAG: hypothetical protein M9894_14190 [Planctomycetes bacterium]|nr:hypothetical protein [Planctomycetota bacterium]